MAQALSKKLMDAAEPDQVSCRPKDVARTECALLDRTGRAAVGSERISVRLIFAPVDATRLMLPGCPTSPAPPTLVNTVNLKLTIVGESRAMVKSPWSVLGVPPTATAGRLEPVKASM